MTSVDREVRTTLKSPHSCALSEPMRTVQIMAKSGRTTTYRQLDRDSSRLAQLMRRTGLSYGSHVALLTGSHGRALMACWAAQRSGMYWTPINTRFTADDIGYILADSGADALIVTERTSSLGRAALDRMSQPPSLTLTLDEAGDGFTGLETAWADVPDSPLPDEREGTDMLYSSGTTGRPKGVVPGEIGRPFGEVDVTMDALRERYGIDRETVFLAATPLFHIAALASALMAQRVGGSVVVMDRFDPVEFLSAVERFRVTHTMVVPTIFSRLLEVPEEKRSAYDLSSLKFVGHGGAPCPPAVKAKALDWLGPMIYDCWGATERPGLTILGPEEWRERPESVGRAFTGWPHALDEDGNELPPGTVGEIFWETPRPFSYHHDPEKTARSRDRRGWCSVGDLGYVDEDGYLFLTDRASFMIISGGENVYPVEVENVLMEHEAVRDVGVVGRPHDDLGQQVVAVIEAKGDPLPSDELAEAIQRFARERLAGYKCPRVIEFRESLPRSATGKLLKRQLM